LDVLEDLLIGFVVWFWRFLISLDEADSETFGSEAASPSDPVEIGLSVLWEIYVV
jgi:hypothetical protein